MPPKRKAEKQNAQGPEVRGLPPGLEVVRLPLAELVPDAANVRLHDERNLGAISASLQQFGQVEPLVVQRSSMRIVGGNGRLEAMRALGWTEADVVLVELDATQATALSLALNRTSELARWDFEGLGRLLRSLQEDGFDSTALGWSDGELKNLLSADWSPPELEALNAETEEALHGPKAIAVTEEQRAAFEEAAGRVRALSGDDALTEGRCLELLCRDYLQRHAATE